MLGFICFNSNHLLTTYTLLCRTKLVSPGNTTKNDASKADILWLGLYLSLLLLTAARTDPFWAVPGQPTSYFRVRARPPPHPNPFKSPNLLATPSSGMIHHATLHRLHHLHLLEGRHARLLHRHGRFSRALPVHLVMHFRPAVPTQPYPPWANEGDFSLAQKWTKMMDW